MKNKLGLISGLILSLVIAGSAFAETGKTNLKNHKSFVSSKFAKNKISKPKKHRKHRKAKRLVLKGVKTKSNPK